MEKIKALLRGRNLVIAAAAAIAVVLLLVAASALRDHFINKGFERREQARQEKREELSEQFDQKMGELRAAKERIAALEQANEQLQQSVAEARREAEAARADRDHIARRYEDLSNELDSISDYAELRRVNCERRARLGYPCDE